MSVPSPQSMAESMMARVGSAVKVPIVPENGTPEARFSVWPPAVLGSTFTLVCAVPSTVFFVGSS